MLLVWVCLNVVSSNAYCLVADCFVVYLVVFFYLFCFVFGLCCLLCFVVVSFVLC